MSTKVRKVCVCLAGNQTITHPFTHLHTLTINRHLVEHNLLAVFLKSDYQLGRDVKLLYLSICVYLPICLSYSQTHTYTFLHQ